MEIELWPASSNTNKHSEIFIKKTSKPSNPTELQERLTLWEKGQLTLSSKIDPMLYKDIIPHKDIPWELYTLCYERSSMVYNGVNNTADFCIQAGFDFEGSTDAKTKIKEWMDKVNFELILRNILIQLQIFGNAYLDISNMQFPKLLPVKSMYVRVQKGGPDDGKVLGYSQMIDSTQEDIKFEEKDIIHFKINDACNPFYGMSELKPVLGSLTRYANWTEDLGQILHRFASPFVHWTVGTEDMPGTQAQVDATVSTIQNRLPGEDFVTSSAVSHDVVQATQGMIQVDNLVKNLQDEIIAGMRIPEIFARGGITSNKAVGDVEMQAFDRKCKALLFVVTMPLEDILFPKITARSSNIKMIWNEFSAEGEKTRAERLKLMVEAGMPLKTSIKMIGWGTWIDEIVKDKEVEEAKAAEKMQQEADIQTQGQISVVKAKPQPKGNSVKSKTKVK